MRKRGSFRNGYDGLYPIIKFRKTTEFDFGVISQGQAAVHGDTFRSPQGEILDISTESNRRQTSLFRLCFFHNYKL